jgi:hypothetical protein
MGIATSLNARSVCYIGMMPKTLSVTMPIAQQRTSTSVAATLDIVLLGLAQLASCTDGMLSGSDAKSTSAQIMTGICVVTQSLVAARSKMICQTATRLSQTQ